MANYTLACASGIYFETGQTTVLSKLGLNSIKVLGYYMPIVNVEGQYIKQITLTSRLNL